MECVFQCGEYIARKEMKQHCQYQCNNATQILSQQEEYKFAVTCFARQESDNISRLIAYFVLYALTICMFGCQESITY